MLSNPQFRSRDLSTAFIGQWEVDGTEEVGTFEVMNGRGRYMYRYLNTFNFLNNHSKVDG